MHHIFTFVPNLTKMEWSCHLIMFVTGMYDTFAGPYACEKTGQCRRDAVIPNQESSITGKKMQQSCHLDMVVKG
jgi:hypothetical protein